VSCPITEQTISSCCSRRSKAGAMSRSPNGPRPSTMPATILRDLADIHFPKADKIVLVQDDLNTHAPASLYEAFQPAEARRIIERFEWHYTPKHGSWLNFAVSELAVLFKPVPRPPHRRRSHSRQRGCGVASAWQYTQRQAQWHFTTTDARVKLKSLYPSPRRGHSGCRRARRCSPCATSCGYASLDA
jgi:DDE superfamily endonuclease